MSNPFSPQTLAAMTAFAMISASPACADTAKGQATILAAAPMGQALSDSDMERLRGGAGLLGLPSGSSTFVQIGATTSAQAQPGSPSSASSALSIGGTSLSASSALGTGAGVPPLSVSRGFTQTYSLSNARTFSLSYTLGL